MQTFDVCKYFNSGRARKLDCVNLETRKSKACSVNWLFLNGISNQKLFLRAKAKSYNLKCVRVSGFII